jgi:nicotinate-nucleotide pyrophosphorylase (carboxylating)
MRLILEPVVRAALLEDLGRAGDITTEAVVPAEATVEAVIAARQPGVLAGLDAALLAFERSFPIWQRSSKRRRAPPKSRRWQS